MRNLGTGGDFEKTIDIVGSDLVPPDSGDKGITEEPPSDEPPEISGTIDNEIAGEYFEKYTEILGKEDEPKIKVGKRGRKSKEELKEEFFQENLPVVSFLTDFIFNKYLGSRSPKWILHSEEKQMIDVAYTELLQKYSGSLLSKWSEEAKVVMVSAMIILPRFFIKDINETKN